MRIAVAGAAGFIGSHVVEHLLEGEHEVLAIDRPGSTLGWAAAAGADTAEVDLSDREAARAAFAGCQRVINSTGLFDLAASRAQLHAVNVGVARAVMDAARHVGAERAVHISSVAVYGHPKRSPMPEDGELTPRNDYEHSKRAGEAAALSYAKRGFDVAVLRPTLVYGPRSRYGQALMIALAAQAKALGVEKLPIFPGGPRGHHVHVTDVARAAALLLEHEDAPGKAFNVADDQPLGVGDSMVAIAEEFGLRVAFGRSPDLLWRALRPAMRRMPRLALARLNRELERGKRALARRGKPSELAPRLDADWLAYFADEHIFDTGRLKRLGFTLRYPDFRGAVPEVVQWYRDARWLPEV